VRPTALALLVMVAIPASGGAQTSSEMTIAQLQYSGSGDWYANPSGLPNLLKAIRARTALPVSERPAATKITDPSLWNYPYLYMTGHGDVRLSEEEVRTLRRYLESGGFLHVDDNYGLDESFRRELRRIFPNAELVELPVDHPIYHAFYDLPGLPKVHEHDGKPPQGFGVFHEGRLVLFYSYESDLGNGWEDASVHNVPPEMREQALRMGVNLFLFALAQTTS
jgi:hypothetical protein